MKRKKLKWNLVILFVFGLRVLCAQIPLNVIEKSGTKTSFMLNDLKRLTFSPGVMTITQRNGNYGDFILTNILNLNFADVTSVEEKKSFGSRNLLLYPNPVKDLLHVQFETDANENVLIQLIDIHGVMILQKYTISLVGSNCIEIPIGSFQYGIYLCRIQTGNKIEINKFIKY